MKENGDEGKETGRKGGIMGDKRKEGQDARRKGDKVFDEMASGRP